MANPPTSGQGSAPSIDAVFHFKGASSVGGGMFGAGSTSGMSIDTDIAFDPTIFMITKGIREAAKAKSVKEPMVRAIERVLIPSIRKNFDSSGRPKKWKPLSAATKNIRTRQGFSAGPPLVKTNKLRNAATAKARWSIKGPKGEALYGNFPGSVPYAGVHQGGQADAWGPGWAAARIPPRPFAVIQEQDMEAMTKIFGDWVQERLEKKIPKSRRR